MEVDAEELVGRVAASLMFMGISPNLHPRAGPRCMVGTTITACSQKFRALFTAVDDNPLLELIVFLEPQILAPAIDAVLARMMTANIHLTAGVFGMRSNEMMFKTSTFLETESLLPTEQMIRSASHAIETWLPDFLEATC